MELALYCPVCGYYETQTGTIGRRGDYYTSVSVGGVFGELLACQFAAWLEEGKAAGCAGPLRIVEAGAHGGELAGDILRWLREQRPAVFDGLEYWIVEPSARRREWQRERLGLFEGKVRWIEAGSFPPGCGRVRGVIFCNELLDAMPVRRFGWDARQRAWFEWGVGGNEAGFTWQRMEPSPGSEVPEVPGDLSEVLPDGFTVESSPAAVTWWRSAASALEWGRLVTIDYGLSQEELFRPERLHGTLRAYQQHRVSSDVLAHPGERDITAHVNFTAIQRAGEEAGLRTEAAVTQERFLTQVAARMWSGDGVPAPWTAAQTRQFQTLTHPEHLGRAFRVLVQGRV